MPDFARFLPLSQRRPGDEADVDSNRRRALADVIAQAGALVRSAASRRSETADDFVYHCGLRAEFATVDAGEPAERLLALSAAVRDGRRRGIRALADGTRALLLVARDHGVEVQLPALTAGAVALYASTTAPLERRAVVKGHTLRATDADWSFGRGPVLEAPATQFAAFLLGASDRPPITPPR